MTAAPTPGSPPDAGGPALDRLVGARVALRHRIGERDGRPCSPTPSVCCPTGASATGSRP
ncbi:hypothetical protein ACFQV8_32100 [Pseudonocardia benzenivorans]